MRQTEMRRNTEIYHSANVPFTEDILLPPVLNSEGGTQSHHRTAYNSSSQQNVSGKTEIRRISETLVSRRSNIPTKGSYGDFSKGFRHLKMQIFT